MNNKEKSEEFKKRLKIAMDNKNITGAELGRLIGRTKATISQYKNTITTLPPYEVIQNISKVLDVPFEYLNLEIDEVQKEIINKAKIEKLKEQMEKDVEQELKQLIEKTKEILKEMEKLNNEINNTKQ